MSMNMNKKFIKDVIGSPELNLRKGHLPVATAVDRFAQYICEQKGLYPVVTRKICNDIMSYRQSYSKIMYAFARNQGVIYEATFVDIFDAIGCFINSGELFNRLFNATQNEQKEYILYTIDVLLHKLQYNNDQINTVKRIVGFSDFKVKDEINNEKLTHTDKVLLDAMTIANGVYNYFEICIKRYCDDTYSEKLLEKILNYTKKYGRNNICTYDICNNVIAPYMKKAMDKIKFENGLRCELGVINDAYYSKIYNEIYDKLFILRESLNVYDRIFMLTESLFNTHYIELAIARWFEKFMKEFYI